LVAGIAVTVLVAATLIGLRGKHRRQDNPSRTPFAYDLDVLRDHTGVAVVFAEHPPFPLAAPAPTAMAAGADGMLHVAGPGELQTLDRTGTLVRTVRLKGAPTALATGVDGRLLVGYPDHVTQIAPGTSVEQTWVSLGEPARIAALAMTNSIVFITDGGNARVWIFDGSGTLRGIIGAPAAGVDRSHFLLPGQAFDTAAAPDGSFWVTNPGWRRIENYGTDGVLRASWGKSGMAPDSFCGCCNPSHIAVLDDGRLVTAEKGLVRVKVFRPDGTFIGLVAGPDRFRSDTEIVDLAVDDAGTVLVLDRAARAIRRFMEIPHADS
jgi:sugar lactone lactonase YvrE